MSNRPIFDRSELAALLEEHGELSAKQAQWVAAVWLDTRVDFHGGMLTLAVARRAGPDLAPFETTDAELIADANRLIDEGCAALARHLGWFGGLQ